MCRVDSTRDSSLMTPHKKSVRFSNVVVREYPMILGDNPSVSHGPPVTISWKHSAEHLLELENHISMTPFPRRSVGQMAMPSFYRKDLLVEAGCSDVDMREATKQARLIKAQRIATVKYHRLATIEELSEKTKRRMKNIFLPFKRR